MRVLVASFQVPFQHGGASYLAEGLIDALKTQGHDADLVTMPFRFFPDIQVRRAMEIWAEEDFSQLNMIEPDLVIPLSFPAIYCRHPNKRPWLMHQFRGAYELYTDNQPLGISEKTRLAIHETDTSALSGCDKVFTISANVTARLKRNNSINSTPLYHPPPLAKHFYTNTAQPFIFAPSRIEQLKRQDLLVQAFALVRSPVGCIIAGMGGQYGALREQVARLGLEHRVRLVGSVSDSDKLSYYANSLGVFFGPIDEDYGYVTLEAMLASKPVITCSDSGGPIEFVRDKETGRIVEPTPEAVAEAIDSLYERKHRATQMGLAGKRHYERLGLSWSRTLDKLLDGLE
jgi:glycosyltransferase involved in cell wall biosynthesis